MGNRGGSTNKWAVFSCALVTAALTKREQVCHHSLQTPHPSEDTKETLDPKALSMFTQAWLPSQGVVPGLGTLNYQTDQGLPTFPGGTAWTS